MVDDLAGSWGAARDERLERLFIRLPGYGRDLQWAQAVDASIRGAAQSPAALQSSDSLLDFLARPQREFAVARARTRLPWCRVFSNEEFAELEAAEGYQEFIHLGDRKFGRLQQDGRLGELPEGTTADDIVRYISAFQTGRRRTRDETGGARTLVTSQYTPYQAACLRQLGVSGLESAAATTTLEADGVTVQLTRLEYSAQENALRWVHPPPAAFDGAKVALETRFRNLLSRPALAAHVVEVMRTIGALHWIIVQCLPFWRGTAAIADAFTKVCAEVHGITVGRWKRGLAPDLEAYTRALPDYMDRYTDFFDVAPAREELRGDV